MAEEAGLLARSLREFCDCSRALRMAEEAGLGAGLWSGEGMREDVEVLCLE
jgi:hypothetical protein